MIALSVRSPTQLFPYSIASVKAQLATFGDIRTFRTIDSESIHVVEYFDDRDAHNARQAWSGFKNSEFEFDCVFEPFVAVRFVLLFFLLLRRGIC